MSGLRSISRIIEFIKPILGLDKEERELLLQLEETRKKLDQTEKMNQNLISDKSVLFKQNKNKDITITAKNKELDSMVSELSILKEQLQAKTVPMHPVEEYYELKYQKIPAVFYTARVDYGNKKSPYQIDVRTFFSNPHAEDLKNVLKEAGVADNQSGDYKAFLIEQWVRKNIRYLTDNLTSGDVPEQWNYYYETLQRRSGDCEDAGILIANLLISSGIEPWRVRITAGDVINPNDNDNSVGHAYCSYCREFDDRWINLDTTYYPKTTPINERSLWKDEKYYLTVWWSFNSKTIWSEAPSVIDLDEFNKFKIKQEV